MSSIQCKGKRLSKEEISRCLSSHHRPGDLPTFRLFLKNFPTRIPRTTYEVYSSATEGNLREFIFKLNIPTFGDKKTVEVGIAPPPGLPPVFNYSLELGEFKPMPGDILTRTWTDSNGNKEAMDLPPYAVDNVEVAWRSFTGHIRDNWMRWMKTADMPFSIVTQLLDSDLVRLAHGP